MISVPTPLNKTTVVNRSAVSYDIMFDYLLFTLALCSTASLVGNTLVIMVIRRCKRLQNTHNYFLVNMAVSDIFIPAIQLLRVMLFERKDVGYISYLLGACLCKFVMFVSYISVGVSLLSLVVVTVDRFYAVIYPTNKTFKKKRVYRFLLFCTWFIPGVVFAPRLYFAAFNPSSNRCRNTMSSKDRTIYNIFIFVVFTVVPFLVMLVLYSKIIRTLVLKQNSFSCHNRSSQAIEKRRNNIRLTKMFLTLIFLYFFTWLIYRISGFVAVYSKNTDKITMRKLRYAVSTFPSIFHAINPIIYFLFCPSFRKELRIMFVC